MGKGLFLISASSPSPGQCAPFTGNAGSQSVNLATSAALVRVNVCRLKSLTSGLDNTQYPLTYVSLPSTLTGDQCHYPPGNRGQEGLGWATGRTDPLLAPRRAGKMPQPQAGAGWSGLTSPNTGQTHLPGIEGTGDPPAPPSCFNCQLL